MAEHYAPAVGGIERHVQELAERFAGAGHVVEVLTHDEADETLPSDQILSGVRVRRFKVPIPSRHYAISPGLAAFISRHRSSYDVIHAHGYHALAALWASRLAGQTTVVFTPHYHGTGHSPFRQALHPVYRPIGRSIFARAACVIAVSNSEADLLRRHFGSVTSEVHVIPNGVDPAEFQNVEPFPRVARLVFSAGRLESYKNLQATLHAIVELDPSFRLHVAGDGPARRSLEDLSHRLGVADRAELLGEIPREQLCRWYCTASVYVTMSQREAMGITVAEALAAGAPVVASDIPAHRELAAREPGRISLLSLGADSHELANAIEQASELPREPRVILSWDEAAEQLMDIYASLT